MRTHSLTTLSRPFWGLVSTVLIALVLTACTKEPGPPSEAYDQASQRFRKLYAQKLDDAFVDPGMDEVEALLEQVPPDSMDAPSARELQQRINEGRARKEEALQAQEDAIASAREVDLGVGSAQPTRPEPEPAPTPAETPDAGLVTEGPVEGSPASELAGGYLGCFQRGKSITVEGKGARDSWEMSDRARCSQSFPRFVGQVVIVEDGKVLAVLPKSSLRVTYQQQDAGPPPGQ